MKIYQAVKNQAMVTTAMIGLGFTAVLFFCLEQSPEFLYTITGFMDQMLEDIEKKYRSEVLKMLKIFTEKVSNPGPFGPRVLLIHTSDSNISVTTSFTPIHYDSSIFKRRTDFSVTDLHFLWRKFDPRNGVKHKVNGQDTQVIQGNQLTFIQTLYQNTTIKYIHGTRREGAAIIKLFSSLFWEPDRTVFKNLREPERDILCIFMNI